MTDFSRITEELDAWGDAGLRAGFWWRDDDAISATDALDSLLLVAGSTPIGLAVIPRDADDTLSKRLSNHKNVFVLQHGWGHINRATIGDNSEYPPGLDRDLVREEFMRGKQTLSAMFPKSYLPIFVPPWHGLCDDYMKEIHDVGIEAVSRKGPRNVRAANGVRFLNAHCAPILWTDPPGFSDPSIYIEQIVEHLRGRRAGDYDEAEATGIITHHLAQNAASMNFLLELRILVETHPAADWISPRAMLA